MTSRTIVPVVLKATFTLSGVYLLNELINWRKQGQAENATIDVPSDLTDKEEWSSKPGSAIPLAKSPYTNASSYLLSPIDPASAGSSLSSFRSYGPFNEPQRNVIIAQNQTRIKYSGYENKANTNLTWPSSNSSNQTSCSCKEINRGIDYRTRDTEKMGIGIEPGSTLFFK